MFVSVFCLSFVSTFVGNGLAVGGISCLSLLSLCGCLFSEWLSCLWQSLIRARISRLLSGGVDDLNSLLCIYRAPNSYRNKIKILTAVVEPELYIWRCFRNKCSSWRVVRSVVLMNVIKWMVWTQEYQLMFVKVHRPGYWSLEEDCWW